MESGQLSIRARAAHAELFSRAEHAAPQRVLPQSSWRCAARAFFVARAWFVCTTRHALLDKRVGACVVS